MKLNLYSIYDRKMNIYLAPFPARNDVDAIRNIKASVSNPDMKQTPVGQNPEDFDLVRIGEFDDESGQIERVHPLILGSVRQITDEVSSRLASSTVAS